MKLLPLATILLGGALPCLADYIIDLDLGTLPLGDTQLVGTTAAAIDPGPPVKIIGGHDQALYVRGIGLNPAGNWGNEIVYQFEILQPSVISITSNSITGDPDFFLLDGVATSIDPNSGKPAGENGLGGAYLDFAPPESASLGAVLPGTYYLLVEHFDGFDGGVLPGDGVFDVTLTVEVATNPFDFEIDLGYIAREGSPLSFDTFGSTFNTELAIYDLFGTLLAENDDAAGGLQSEVTFPTGLAAGDYYAVIAGHDTTFGEGFLLSSGGATGDWIFNFPLGPTFGPGVESGTTYPASTAGEVRYLLFSISAAPADPIDLGRIAAADEPFTIDTIGSNFGTNSVENDTQIGIFDSEGFFLYFNDDIDFPGGNYLSELSLGLPAGEYFLALTGYPNFFGDGFFVTVDTAPQGFSFGGDYVLNYPGGPATGNILVNGQEWFRFEIGAAAVSGIAITDIAYNRASSQFTVTWESSLPGPFNIFVGDGAALSALGAAPANVLPTLGAASVTSPATFTVPLPLQGQPQLFLQVTD